MAMQGSQPHPKRSAEDTEAWILGSGIASLASALYLVKHANVRPSKVHVLDTHASLEQASHKKGNSASGYDQFAGCLPVPLGSPMKELLAMIPSTTVQGRSILDEIQRAQASRLTERGNDRTRFLAQKKGCLYHIAIESLNLSYRHRAALIYLLLKRERALTKRQIRDMLPSSFFESAFWAVWSAQFGFQPWHCAAEFRRAVRQYISEFHNLSILSCLDITGYYQYESISLPIYHYLRSCGVDFQFATEVKNVKMSQNANQRTITGLQLVHEGYESYKSLRSDDIVIANLGSTVSGSAIGTNDVPPIWNSIEANDMLDQNWSVWLDLGNKHHSFGNPYNFCTRQCESMLESFTITTSDLEFFDNLRLLSRCTSDAGAFIFLKDSRWRINLCIPSQPVFPDQPRNVRVLWGSAHSPECEGNYVNKPMLYCSGADVMTELLGHLSLHHRRPILHTITVPRAMPRMSAILLTKAPRDRPQIIPQNVSNLGVVGQFAEIPQRTSVDVSYGIRTAQIAVARLMGLQDPNDPSVSSVSIISKVLFWRLYYVNRHFRKEYSSSGL